MFRYSSRYVITALSNVHFATLAGTLLKQRNKPCQRKKTPNNKNLLSKESRWNNQNTTSLSTPRMDTNSAKFGCTSFPPVALCYWTALQSVPIPLLSLWDPHIRPLPFCALFTLKTAITAYTETLWCLQSIWLTPQSQSYTFYYSTVPWKI